MTGVSAEAEILPSDPIGDRKPRRDGYEQRDEVSVVFIVAH
jgi:hypothetical protein